MLSILSEVEMFKTIPAAGLALLEQRGQIRTFGARRALMRQEDPGRCMYVVVKGRVRVERGHRHLTQPIVLAELGPGEVVGATGLLDDAPRAATVTAVDETEALELDVTALAHLVIQFPDVSMTLLRSLSRRLRSTDELVEQMSRRIGSQ
jgi:CRP/FNR family transcriptional regulator, cyclic AMP receptor protein